MALRSDSSQNSDSFEFLRTRRQATHFREWRRSHHSGAQRSSSAFSPSLIDSLTCFACGEQWQKKNNWLVAFGGLSKGRFLVIPAEKARSYQPGSDLVKTLPQCAQRLAKFSEDELIYARDLALWSKRYDVVGNHVDPGIGLDKAPVDVKVVSKQLSKGGGNGRKQVTISQLEPTVFADVQGEVGSLSLCIPIRPECD